MHLSNMLPHDLMSFNRKTPKLRNALLRHFLASLLGLRTLAQFQLTQRKMPPKHQILNHFQKLFSPKTTKINHLSRRPLCIMTESPLKPDSPESPDLPNWLHNDQNPESADPDNDDFVIPSLANWVENNNNLKTHKKVDTHFLHEANVSDVDKLSAILEKHYPSKDAVVQALLNECDVNATNALVSQLLKRFSNDWVPAFGVFIWAKNQTGYMHTSELYDFMVDILGRCKKFSLMWELVKEMNGLNGYVSLVTMTKVIRRLTKASKYEDAIEAFRGMENFGVKKDLEALNVLMDALVKEGSVENAHSVFVEFKDCIPINSSSFNVLIHGYCKARMLHDARKIMDEMEKHGFHPDVVSYTCFIEAYCKEKDFRKVDATLDEMQEKGCKPNVITYTIVMHALGKAKQIDEALEVYEKMKRNGCVPDTSFYSSLLFVLSKSGRIKDAWDVFEDMQKQGVSRDLLTYNTMIASACTHLQEENALKLLRRMEQDLCKPDVGTYGPLLKLCCRKRRMKVLKFLLSHMFKNDVSIDLGTYALLVHGLCKSGKLEQACSFFEESVLKGMVPRDSTYKMLVEVLEKKNMAEAKEKIEKLMLLAKEQRAV